MESDQEDVTLSNVRARLLELTQIGEYVVIKYLLSRSQLLIILTRITQTFTHIIPLERYYRYDEDPETKRQNDILKYEHQVEDSMIYGMRKTFGKMCRGSSGVVSGKEIRRILELHGQDVTREDLAYVLETFSEGRSDRYMDFLDYSLHLSEQMRSSDEPLNVIFDTMNRNLSGELQRDQILRWAKMMDENITKSEATAMLKKVWNKEDLRHILSERTHATRASRTDEYYDSHKHSANHEAAKSKFVEKKPKGSSSSSGGGGEDVRKNPKYAKYVKLIEMHATREQIQAKLKKDNPELSFKLLEPLFE